MSNMLINTLLNKAIDSIAEIKNPENRVDAIIKIIPLIPEDFSMENEPKKNKIKEKESTVVPTEVPEEVVETVKAVMEEVKEAENKENHEKETEPVNGFETFMKQYGSSSVAEVMRAHSEYLKDYIPMVQKYAKTIIENKYGKNSDKFNGPECNKIINELAKEHYNENSFTAMTVDKFINEFIPFIEAFNTMTDLRKEELTLVLKEIAGDTNSFLSKGISAITPSNYKPIRKSYEELKSKNLI